MSLSPKGRRSHSPGDENTPLLSTSVGGRPPPRRSIPRISDFHRPQSLPANNAFPGSHRSSFVTRTSDVEVDDLRLDLARVGSVGSLTGEYGNPYQTADPIATWGRKGSQAIITEDDDESVAEDALTPIEDEPLGEIEDKYEHTKFMNITPGRFWLVFMVVLICYFVACFDSTLMASSHPVITSYFGASKAASWLSTTFLITSTAFQPLFGRFSDTFGRRYVYTAALLIFSATTAWCGLAQSIGSFIAARAASGLGAGGTMSMSLIILSDCIRIEHRGVFQSHVNIAFGLGSASGAAFGGYLCDTLGWRWAFGVQVPLILIGAVLAYFFTPAHLGPMFIKSSSGSAFEALKKFDWLGSALLITTVSSLILALNLGGNIYPWVSPPVIACFVLFAIFAPIFVYQETRALQPLMPIRLLTRRPVANLILSNTLGGIATNTVLFNVPLFFQAVLLTSASDSGFRLAVPSFVGSLAGISSGYIITYTRRLKPTLALGSLVYLCGSIAVCFLQRGVIEILSLVLISGVPLGQGWLFPSTIMASLAVSEQADQAIVNTTLGLWRNIGTVLGIAISSLVFQNMLGAQLESKVQGEDKEKVIEAVRSSVKAIRLLKGAQLEQVIDAYALSLRVTFTVAVAASIVLCMLILPLKLPRLMARQKVVAHAGE
ncbi:MFS-type transporter-like protein 7 [Elsinoe fawcettii]|nr:MFS-type transporter-like protein 7 [Elsinoe fawcettii]